MLLRLASICCLVVLFSNPIRGQPLHDCAYLRNALTISEGAEVQVRTSDAKRRRGEFRAVQDDALIIAATNGEERLPCTAVSRVAVRKPGHRLRNTLIGLGIGAGLGLMIGAVVDARCTGKCIEGNRPLGKEFLTPLGAIVGTIIGVALPTGGWREVYRAP